MELVGNVPEATRGRAANRRFDEIRENLRAAPNEWWLIDSHETHSQAGNRAKSILGRKADGSAKYPEFECTTRTDPATRQIQLYARYTGASA